MLHFFIFYGKIRFKEPEEEPENETKELDTTENEPNDTETPGFDIIALILAVSIILILKKRKMI